MSHASPAPLVIWHGYLLSATGSNIYTFELVDSWVRAGRDVVLACQEPDPLRHPHVHEVVQLSHDRTSGAVSVADRQHLREPGPSHGRCTMVVPDIHALLPVYVLDRYEGFEVARLTQLDESRREAYAADQAAAMRWVIASFGAAGVLINHATPLPAAIGPVLDAAGVPYAVKVHGSELEYALAEDASLVPSTAAALERAASVLVGSGHIAARTAELLGGSCLAGHTHVLPPGVDLERFAPIEPGAGARRQAAERLAAELADRERAQPHGRTVAASMRVRELVAGPAEPLVAGLRDIGPSYEERHVEQGAGGAVRDLLAAEHAPRVVTYVGKLIPQKGVHLLLAALPDVLEAHPDTQLVIAGFGPMRDGLEALLVAMRTGNVAALDALAASMGALSGEGGERLEHLADHLAWLRSTGSLDAWLERAARHRVDERVTWLGLVDHGVLAELWPMAEASMVPSVLAEAFGMVAAEAAACGCVPIVADHSGLADAASVIELDGVEPVRVSSVPGDASVTSAWAAALIARLAIDEPERSRQRAAARANVAQAWGWDQLAERAVQLMCGSSAR